MAEFKGYLIKLNGIEFPHEYIALENYKSIDNQRTELKAYRNSQYDLIRQTSSNFKSKVEFSTIDGLNLKQLEKIKNVIDKATLNKTERKVKVEYWNSEELRYATMKSYIPDIEYEIKKIKRGSKPDIIYKPLRYCFIQY